MPVSRRTINHPRGIGRSSLALLLIAGLLWSQDTTPPSSSYSVNSSTTTAHTHQHKRPLHRLRAAGNRVLTPGSKLQGPNTSPLPVNPPMVPPAPVIPPPQLPKMPRSERFLRAAAKVMTHSWGDSNIFVFLPAISTDPNSGPTVGVLPVWVLSDPTTHHIRHLIAPSYTYNDLFGQTFTGRYFFYPTDASQFYTIGSYSTRTNRELRARYVNSAFLGGRAFIHAEGGRDVDGSLRFFGVGPQTGSGDETGYVGNNTEAHVSMGVNFLNVWRASLGTQFRHLATNSNIVENIKDLQTTFPTLPGVSTDEKTVTQDIRLVLDSRDFPVTPSRGSSAELFGEKTTQAWGSDADFIRYGIEGKHYFPWDDKQLTEVHGLYDWMNGPNIPFYELANLGGRETLRAFEEGRFSDKGRIVFNVEHRYTVASIPLMGVQTNFEVGPFVDIGTVFPRAGDIQGKYFTPVVGGAFRAAVKPNVVGSVDVGVGKEGPGVFVGINYPF